MPSKPGRGAFVLTPVGSEKGRYDVRRTDPSRVARDGTSGQFRTVKESTARSKATIQDIVRTHAAGLKRLADR